MKYFVEIFCLMAFLLCMAFFFFIMENVFRTGRPLPSEVSQIMIAVIGIAGSIVGYVVGSSKGSQDKDRLITNLTKPEAKATVVTDGDTKTMTATTN